MNRQPRTSANFEHEIDATLKMLGDVQPPAGLASRIHHSLETSSISSQKDFRWSLWLPAAGAVMAALLLAAFLQARSARPKQAATVQIAELPAMNSVAAEIHLPAESVSKQNVAILANRRHPVGRRRPTYRRVNNLMSYPLTRQEKLLVQFAEHAKPEDLRDLNPEYQAKVEAQQKAEFAAYVKSGSSSSKQVTTEAAEAN